MIACSIYLYYIDLKFRGTRRLSDALCVIMLGWKIAYEGIWCGDDAWIDDRVSLDVNLEDCQKICLNDANCNFMFYGDDVWGDYTANRCTLFRTCDDRTKYTKNHPIVYYRPSTGNDSIITL